MDVICQVESVDIENGQGRMIEGVRVVCPRCNQSQECMGTSDRSLKRALALMREACLNKEKNHYTCEALIGERKPWEKQAETTQVEVYVPPIPPKEGRDPITRVTYDYTYLWRQSRGDTGGMAWQRLFGVAVPSRDEAAQVITRKDEEELWFVLNNQIVVYIVHPEGDAIASVVCHLLLV